MAKVSDAILLKEHNDYMAEKDFTKKTIQNYSSCTRIYANWLKGKKKSILDVQDMKDKAVIEQFLRFLRTDYTNGSGRSLSYARLKVYFSALNSLYDHLEYNQHVSYNIILKVRSHYLRTFKNGYVAARRKDISLDEMNRYLNSIMILTDKIINIVLLKTGVRRAELIAMDVDDIDWQIGAIKLKDRVFKKRTNLYAFFDEETGRLLKMWLKRREMIARPGEKALFVGKYGIRVNKNIVYDAVTRWSSRFIGEGGQQLHDASSSRLEDHFTPHNLRHCYTTFLRRDIDGNNNRLDKEIVKELRGDKRGDVIDIYDHIHLSELRRAYLARMPKFGL